LTIRERVPSRFETWAWSPIIVLRIALVITYLLFIYLGIISIRAGIPVFDLTALPGYATIWGALLTAAAIVAAVSSIAERWEYIERWASLAVSSLYLAYAGAVNIVGFVSGDIDRQTVGAALLIGLVLPACRFVYLAAQAGKARKPKKKAAK